MCSTIVGVFALIIVLVKSKEDVLHKSLLSIFVLSLTYYSFLIYMVISEQIMAYPHLYRTGIALPYVIPICFYLLGRLKLEPERPIRWWEWTLFIIPFFNTMEHIPFYSLDGESKKEFLNVLYIKGRENIYYAHESFVPVYYNYVGQLVLGTILYVLIMRKAIVCMRDKDHKSKQERLNCTWWFFPGLLLSVCSVFALVGIITKSFEGILHVVASAMYGVTLLGIVLYFFLKPEIIYGEGLQEVKPKKLKKNRSLSYSPREIEGYHKSIEDYFTTNKEFLKIAFRQQDLADALKLKKHVVSHLINHIYGMNFNQLVNERRIKMALEEWDNPQWKNLSMDGIAKEVGFGSRTTFIKAFRNQTGVCPSEYQAPTQTK
nr:MULTISPECIES: helix-turn-helix domain-containing protein [unclassified Allomuricauda]